LQGLGNELPQTITIAIIIEGAKSAPTRLRDQLVANASRWTTVQQIEDFILGYHQQMLTYQPGTRDRGSGDAMDIDGQFKGKPGGKSGKGKGTDGKTYGDGKGNGGKAPGGKSDHYGSGKPYGKHSYGGGTSSAGAKSNQDGGKQGKGGKTSSSSWQSPQSAQFAGYCGTCGKWGHKSADCRSGGGGRPQS